MEQQIKKHEVLEDTSSKNASSIQFAVGVMALTALLLGSATTTSGRTANSELETFAKSVFDQRLPNAYKSQSEKLAKTLVEQSKLHGLHPLMILALIETESGFNVNAIGGVGEIGLMQVRPSTARILLHSSVKFAREQLKNPVKNLEIGIRYLAEQRSVKSNFSATAKTHFILASYNMGPGKFNQAFKKGVRKTKYSNKIVKRSFEFHQFLLGIVPPMKTTVRASAKFAQL